MILWFCLSFESGESRSPICLENETNKKARLSLSKWVQSKVPWGFVFSFTIICES
jgi:hypothetical protein